METKAQLSDQITERERRNTALSLEVAKEGVVLLENKGVLPLAPCRIALYGIGADYTIKGGSGSGEVNVRHSVTVREGLEAAGFVITTQDWIDRYDSQWKEGKEQFLSKMRRKLWWPSTRVFNEVMSAEYRFPFGDRLTEEELRACETDTCFYVVSRQSGEGHDMRDDAGSFRLDETEEYNIRCCAAHFKRFVLLINTGCPIDLSPLETIEGIDAIVYMSQLGMEGGTALAAVLTGQCSPCGKLAVTWPKRYADVPFGEEFAVDSAHAIYKEGIYVGYRYYDSFGVEPRYAFGYGLSYTDFAIEVLETRQEKDKVACTVKVSNTGKQYAGKEVVQVYVRCPGAEREYQRLVAFGKTEVLAPGESQTLILPFDIADLSYYEEVSGETKVSEGKYLVCVGFSSRKTSPVAVLKIDAPIVLTKHKNLSAANAKKCELHFDNFFAIQKDIPELTVKAADFATKIIDYTESGKEHFDARTEAILDSLTAEDRIKFCAGTGFAGEKKGFRCPGSVGHTTTDYLDRGIPNAEMCDGPAGIRLEKRAVQYPDGDIRALDLSISVYEFFPRFLLRWFVLGNPAKGQTVYQFVTGFPIAAAVAQTWNTDLAERMGRAVSEEMQEYGVTFWLAPGMNIVRNPLCGRNFEYYSEDPLVTGKMAASVTRGVQVSPETIVTLKHFCANNQESNRYTISSDVDERTLREIYWKGFERAVKEAHPGAVMAAYNRLNGVFCANNHALCTDLLRAEWGFDGIVMTDWFSTGKELADEAGCTRAGVDLIMPGGKNDLKALRKAYKEGRLSDADIRRAAGRMLRKVIGKR